MCTLAVYREVSPLFPLIVVANRDEFLGRASAPPAIWSDDTAVVAGRDLVAGGTWLGCRTDGSGRVVGVLNRRPAVDRAASGPGELSRGQLCIDALRAASSSAVAESLDAVQAARYGGFNLFVADLTGAMVLDNGGGVRRVPLADGLSVLTNLDVNDPRCPRLAGATRRFQALSEHLRAGGDVDVAVPLLAEVLSSHRDGEDQAPSSSLPFSKICVHVDQYGTRSSTMIFVREDGAVRYFHADGAPCQSRFFEVAVGGVAA